MCGGDSLKNRPKPGDPEPPTHSEIGRWILHGDKRNRQERARRRGHWAVAVARLFEWGTA